MQVLTRAELLLQVGGRRAFDEALLAGAWRRVLRGVYVPSSAPDDLRTRALAAARVLPPGAAVADRCLLWLLGVDVLPPGVPVLEVVVARGAVLPVRQGVRVREAALPPADLAVAAGVLPVLRPTRAVGDLLRLLPLVEAVVVADAVRRARLCTAEQLAGELAGHARLRGVCSARRALALSDPRAESPPETRVRLLLVRSGLAPVPQFDVYDAAGRWLARVDFAFPEQRVAVEYDGREPHVREDVFVRDRRRQNALLAAGWTVLRFTADDLRQPYALVQQVTATLVRRAA